jgi:enoyl-[acyl-carrier protein] reductase II
MNRQAARQRLDQLWGRGRAFLGCDLAILGGAMTWVSERHLVSALSNAGGFGVIASGSMSPGLLAAEIAGTAALTDRPFGVNLITMHPQLMELIDVCLDHKVGHIVLAGGLPPGAALTRIKQGGAKLLCFAPALVIARKLVRSGADAIIIEGMEAGGHIGPVTTSVLAQEILPAIRECRCSWPAASPRRGHLGYLEMGASGCQLGTRFVCANESIAHPLFKKAFIRASARDAVPSVQLDPRFPVIPVRALVNDGVRRFMDFQREMIGRVDRGEIDQKAAQLEIEHLGRCPAPRRHRRRRRERLAMAGQSVGMVTKEQPLPEILQELVDQAVDALLAREQNQVPAAETRRIGAAG